MGQIKFAQSTRMVTENEDFITKLSRTIAAQEKFHDLAFQPEKPQMMIMVGTLNDWSQGKQKKVCWQKHLQELKLNTQLQNISPGSWIQDTHRSGIRHKFENLENTRGVCDYTINNTGVRTKKKKVFLKKYSAFIFEICSLASTGTEVLKK